MRSSLRLQVGLVTYGTHVHVHELGFSECAKSYVFQVIYGPLSVQSAGAA